MTRENCKKCHFLQADFDFAELRSAHRIEADIIIQINSHKLYKLMIAIDSFS